MQCSSYISFFPLPSFDVPFISHHRTALSFNLGNDPFSACSNKRSNLLVIILLNDGSDEAANDDIGCALICRHWTNCLVGVCSTHGTRWRAVSRHTTGRRVLLQHLYSISYVLTYLLAYVLTYLLTYLLAYLLTDWLTYLLTDWLTYLLTDLLTYLLTDLLTYLLTDLLTYLLTDLLTYWLTDLLTYLLTYLLTDWLTDWLTYLLTHLLTYLLTYLLITYLLTYLLT